MWHENIKAKSLVSGIVRLQTNVFYMKGSNNILADAISRLKTLDIYGEPLESPKTSNMTNCIIV